MPSYIYVVLWYILAAYMFYVAVKESRFFFVIAGFFIFLGSWALADNLVEADLMGGVYGWIYRGVAIVVLILCALRYYFYKKNG